MKTKLVLMAMVAMAVRVVAASEQWDHPTFCSCVKTWLAIAAQKPIGTFESPGFIVNTDKHAISIGARDVQKHDDKFDSTIMMHLTSHQTAKGGGAMLVSSGNPNASITFKTNHSGGYEVPALSMPLYMHKDDFVDNARNCAFARENEQSIKNFEKVLHLFELQKYQEQLRGRYNERNISSQQKAAVMQEMLEINDSIQAMK